MPSYGWYVFIGNETSMSALGFFGIIMLMKSLMVRACDTLFSNVLVGFNADVD